MERLFVYGTLRLGEKNEHADQLAKTARHLGAATVAGRLYRVSHYPALVSTGSNDERVVGDLFEGINEQLLKRLDEYEGSEYQREITQAKMQDGRTLEAYVYRYALPTDSLERIRSGDWNNLTGPHD